MKINFTKKEYQTLLDMLYISNWVMNAHAEKRTAEINQYKELEAKILELAGEFGMESFVGCDEQNGEYVFSQQFAKESKVRAFIDAFENATFWEELLERLARRDFIKTYGAQAILNMPVSEQFEKEMLLQQKYDKEFGENGLENLKVEL